MAQVQNASALIAPQGNPQQMADPAYMQQILQLQRQQAMAQALTEQGMAPIDYDNRGRISPWQGVNKLASALLGGYTANNAMKTQAQIQAQSVQQNLQQLGAGQNSPGGMAISSQQSPGAGPTNEAAATIPSHTSWAQGQGLSGAVSPTPMNQVGLSPNLLLAAQMGNPTAIAQRDALLKNYEQTPEIKNNNWMGMSPDQVRLNAQGKAIKEAQIEYKPGDFTGNPITGQNGFYPKLPDYAQPTGPVGANGYVGGVAPVKGAIPTAASTSGAVAGADAGARFPYAVQSVINPENNQPSLATNGSLFPSVGGAPRAAMPPTSASGAPQPQAHAFAAPAGTPGPQFVPSGMTPTAAALTTHGTKLLSDAQTDQKNNQSSYAALEEMEGLLKSGAKFGPGTAGLAHFKALANNYVPGIDLSGAQTNQDVMHKLASTLAGSQSPRSDADLANWQARYPSGELTNQASAELIPILRRNAQVVDARANVMTRNAGDGLHKLPDLANQFNQIASPSIVADGRALTQAQQGGPQAVAAFKSQFIAAHPNDWQQRIQAIKQLDGMKAF